MSKINLNKKDCALIIKENGNIEMIIPEMRDDEMTTNSIHLTVTLCVLFKNKNKELTELLNRNWEKFSKEAMVL